MRVPFVDLRAQYRRIESDIQARIQAVLEHGQYIMGPEVQELEQALSRFAGGPHTVAVSSGTDALLMALMALGVGPGDAVFIPAFTFSATAEVVLLAGATPVFVDVDPRTFNIDPAQLAEQVVMTAARTALRPRVAIAVDLFGLPADYARLRPICEENGMELVADAAQSFGASLDAQRVGTLAAITATSFYPAKPLGGYGDGGAVFTTRTETAELLQSIREHGQGEQRYEIVRVGINGRLDTLQAAILLPKLEILEEEIEARESLARFYDERLAGAVSVPQRVEGARSAWAQYSILVEGRDAVTRALADAELPAAIYYPRPLHLQTAYAEFGGGEGSMPVSEDLCSRILSLPMHPYLDRADAERICKAVLRGTGR
jgi:dTDP-4-amino-4,6-dideoxygalactose transaminase